ncbi:MAG: PqiC family protein [Verrucomicrobiota bacterium]
MPASTPRLTPLLTAALLVAALPACSLLEPTSDPTEFYVLENFTGENAPPKLTSNSNLAVQIGPAAIPGYLDRNPIVTFKPGNVLSVPEFHLWGEPVQGAITRVLADNVSHLIDSPNVVPFPQVSLSNYDYRVSLVIRHFEKNSSGQVLLDSNYTIEGKPASGIDSASFSRTITIPLAAVDPEAPLTDEYTAIAEAMSKALGELSSSIARNLLNKYRLDLRKKQEAAAPPASDSSIAPDSL